jgi:hypothetical protein
VWVWICYQKWPPTVPLVTGNCGISISKKLFKLVEFWLSGIIRHVYPKLGKERATCSESSHPAAATAHGDSVLLFIWIIIPSREVSSVPFTNLSLHVLKQSGTSQQKLLGNHNSQSDGLDCREASSGLSVTEETAFPWKVAENGETSSSLNVGERLKCLPGWKKRGALSLESQASPPEQMLP